jgi:hypothetical protein
MINYQQIQRLFGTPLNTPSTSKATLSGLQVIGVAIVIGPAGYGLYELFEGKPEAPKSTQPKPALASATKKELGPITI